MENLNTPRPFNEWRLDKFDRAEDAAYTFGNHIIKYCRDEVINNMPKETSDVEKENVKAAIHNSLHNVMDLLEGYWPLKAGEDYSVEYILQVVIKDKDRNELEKIEISPSKLDLPIGFWKWADDGEFR